MRRDGPGADRDADGGVRKPTRPTRLPNSSNYYSLLPSPTRLLPWPMPLATSSSSCGRSNRTARSWRHRRPRLSSFPAASSGVEWFFLFTGSEGRGGTRVNLTGGNRSGLTGYRSNRSGPVPVWPVPNRPKFKI